MKRDFLVFAIAIIFYCIVLAIMNYFKKSGMNFNFDFFMEVFRFIMVIIVVLIIGGYKKKDTKK